MNSPGSGTADDTSVRVAVLASGGGSNLQALIDHLNLAGSDAARVALVVSDRADAGALERARRAGIPARVIAVKERVPAEVAAEMLAAFDEHGIDMVALAGYLRLVPAEVVRRYAGNILNIHPALLPKYGGPGMYGLRVHRAVVESGAPVSGATVHLVDEEYDRGRILAQWPVPVHADDTAETLAARVLAVEHVLYPAVVEWLAAGGGSEVPTGSARAGTRVPAGFGVTAEGLAPGTRPPSIEDVRAMLGLTHSAHDDGSGSA